MPCYQFIYCSIEAKFDRIPKSLALPGTDLLSNLTWQTARSITFDFAELLIFASISGNFAAFKGSEIITILH